jgi:hypothetical protein
MIISIILLILLLSVAGYSIYNLLQRNEILEDLVNEQATKLSDIRTTVLDIEAKLIALDIKGSFESDDEVGFFFEEVKALGRELKETIQDTYDN